MTQRLPFAVILNPLAGRGLAAREWPRLEAELRRRQLPFELFTTTSGADALARVHSLPSGQPIMTVGGDGTVNALLPALAYTGRPLAAIPLGSGNDFAGYLGLKPGDFAEALGRLSYQPRQLDVLDVQVLAGDFAGTRRLLLNGLGMGLDAQVNEEMLSAPAAWPGFWRYAWGAVRAIRGPIRSGVEIVLDGQTLYAGESLVCAIMNGTRVGGGFHMTPTADARDGKLNVVASGSLSQLRLLQTILRLLPGTHLGQPGVYHGTGQSVTVRWQKPMFLHLDGDACGKVQELRADILPGAVLMLNA